MSRSDMKRGATQANEESSRLGQAKRLGEALGGMSAFIVAINRLTERIEALEKEVEELRADGISYGGTHDH